MKKDKEMDEEITTELARELIDYAQETGVFTWKTRERHWFMSDQDFNRWNNRYAGKVAGCIQKCVSGYPQLSIKVLGKSHKAHRLAFIWMGQAVPEQVDHLNRDSMDNRWGNLGVSSAKENAKNKSMHNNNTSGVTGVSWDKEKNKWTTRVNINGKRKYLGYFESWEEAKKAVKAFRLANGYSKGHGKELANYVDRTGLCL